MLINYRNLICKDKILAIYPKLFIKGMDASVLSSLSLNEKVVCTILYVNNILKEFKHIKSNPTSEINEIFIYLNNVLVLIDKNEAYFSSLLGDIFSIINDYSTKNKFYINFYTQASKELSSIWYLIVLTYSLTNNTITSLNEGGSGFVNRLEFEFYSSNITWVLTFLNLSKDPQDTLIRIAMLLSNKHLHEKKLFLVKDKKLISNFYLKFVNVDLLTFDKSTQFEIGLEPYMLSGSGFVSSTFLSYKPYIKKSKNQLSTNYVSPKALVSLSSRPLFLDVLGKFSIIEEVFYRSINDTTKYSDTSLREAIESLNFAILKEGDDAVVADLKKKKNRAYYFLLSKKFISLEINKLYFSYFYDWRGRFYSYSPLDPLYNKHLRPFYKLESVLNESSLTSSQFFIKINRLTSNMFSSDLIKNYFISIIYLEIGKMHTKSLISLNKYSLNITEIIGLGISKSGEELISMEDELYRLSMVDELLYLKSNDRPRNFTVFKDATASSFQHWAVLLGLKKEYGPLLNFSGDSWTDVYSFIIFLFVESYPHWSGAPYLNRKSLKQFIMIVGYNSGPKNCLKHLKASCKDLGLHISNEELLKFANEFHKFIKKELFETFYIKNKDILKTKDFLLLKDAEINLNYFYTRLNPTKKDFKVEDKRWILTKNSVSLHLDNRSKLTAINANVVQALDAEFARFIAVNMKNVIIIHDAFGVSIFDLHKLIGLSNSYFNEKFDDKGFCLFILI